ncbi:MAG: hypothetical protein HGA45_16720, partial [Chloroflexales bacterium]|nr:hypothetical protein [Chloroflexales bacterium]
MSLRLLVAALAATLLAGASAAQAARWSPAGPAPAPASPGMAVGSPRSAAPPAA